MINKQKIVTIIFVFFSSIMFAQNTQLHSMGVQFMIERNNILLRWAPLNYSQWKLGNDNEYCIQRFLIDAKVGLVLDKQEFVKLLNYDQWESVTDTSDYAAIVAQSIFGEEFRFNSVKTNLIDFINIANEQENRYSVAMILASQNFELAKYMALGDVQVIDTNQKYFFKIFVKSENSVIRSDTALLFVDPLQKVMLPKIGDVSCQFNNNQVIVKWAKAVINDFYNNYIIERSIDSLNFIPLNENIRLNFFKDDNESFNIYIDTVSEIQQKYYYRIKGVNSFGRYSQYSDIGSISTYPSINVKPNIDTLYLSANSSLNMHWSFPDSLNNSIQGFRIFVSNKINSGYEPTSNDTLLPSTRRYSFQRKSPISYLLLATYDLGGNALFSLPQMIQQKDSIPPEIPKGITGRSDKNGLVTIKWHKNVDEDIAGYRVFYSTNPDKEFTKISSGLVIQDSFSYQFPLNWLNHQVYVKVLAEDNFFNYSKLSEPIEIILPDTIPPSPAVIYDYNSLPEGNCFKWRNSSSDDVMLTYVIRENEGNKDTLLVFFKDLEEDYIDQDSQQIGFCFYYLITIDSSGNLARSNKVKMAFTKNSTKVKLIAISNHEDKTILLQWEETPDQIDKVIIYRSQFQEKLRIYRTIEMPDKKFIDKEVTINQTYNYRIKYFFKSGKTSFSNRVISKI